MGLTTFFILILPWFFLTIGTAVGICALCAFFGNKEPSQKLAPTPNPVVLRPAVSERPMPSEGVLHHAHRLAHA